MNSFTLASRTPFGASNDTIDVEVSEDVVVLVHHGTIEASQKKSGHKGSLQSWYYTLPLSAIQWARMEVLHHSSERPAILRGMYDVDPSSVESPQDEMRLLIRAVAQNQATTIALKGELKRLSDLEHFLAKHTIRTQRMTGAALA